VADQGVEANGILELESGKEAAAHLDAEDRVMLTCVPGFRAFAIVDCLSGPLGAGGL
jgi:hypothetical protein